VTESDLPVLSIGIQSHGKRSFGKQLFDGELLKKNNFIEKYF